MKTYKILAHALVLGVITTPFMVGAAGFVPCGGPTEASCTFDDLIIMINKLIQFALYGLVMPLAAVAFMWAGASLVLQQDKHHAWTEAKERFTDVFIGIAIIMAAFVVVKFILFTFLKADQYSFVQFLLKFE